MRDYWDSITTRLFEYWTSFNTWLAGLSDGQIAAYPALILAIFVTIKFIYVRIQAKKAAKQQAAQRDRQRKEEAKQQQEKLAQQEKHHQEKLAQQEKQHQETLAQQEKQTVVFTPANPISQNPHPINRPVPFPTIAKPDYFCTAIC